MNEPTTDTNVISAEQSDRKHRSRRLFRWLLVTLAVVVIVPTGVFMYRWHVRLGQIEQLENHGKVTCTRTSPEWMWNLLGDRVRGLEHVESVGIDQLHANLPSLEEQLSIVTDLRVPDVTLAYWKLTPQAARHLVSNPRLVSLEVWSLRFSMENAHPFYGNLDLLKAEPIEIETPPEYVYLSKPMPAGFLSELMKSESLKTLRISTAQLPAGVFSIVSKSRSLCELSLVDCEIVGGDPGQFADLPTLISLTLSGSFVTDNSFESLAACPALRELSISAAAITDDGLKSLYDLQQIKVLRIGATPITEDGIRELQAALPGCQIDYKPPTGE